MGEVPTITVGHHTSDEIRALRISLHKIQEMSSWDGESLDAELAYLFDVDVDLVTFTALSTEEFDLHLSASRDQAKSDPADILPVISGPVSRLGNVCEFKGGHALACADALDRLTYTRWSAAGWLADRSEILIPALWQNHPGTEGLAEPSSHLHVNAPARRVRESRPAPLLQVSPENRVRNGPADDLRLRRTGRDANLSDVSWLGCSPDFNGPCS